MEKRKTCESCHWNTFTTFSAQTKFLLLLSSLKHLGVFAVVWCLLLCQIFASLRTERLKWKRSDFSLCGSFVNTVGAFLNSSFAILLKKDRENAYVCPNYLIAPTHEQTVYFWKLTTCSLSLPWPQEWGQTTCQNVQRGKRNKAHPSPSASTANCTVQVLLPGVCVYVYFWV